MSSTNNRDTLWTAVLADLARELSASEFDTWFRDTRLLELTASRAVVGTANVFARDAIAATFGRQLARAVSEHRGQLTDLEVVIG